MSTTLRTAPHEPPGSAAQRSPLRLYLLLALPLSWVVLGIPIATGLRTDPFLLLLIVAIVAPALFVTRRAEGPGGIRRLLGRAFRWRFSPWHYAVVLLGMPAATILVGTVAGTAVAPEDWTAFALAYLLDTIVIGALIINLWEEAAWTGFFQSRLMDRHGLLAGALMTAPWFFAVHVPMSFFPGWTWSSALTNLALVAVIAPFMRYLLGMQYLDTRGSLLVVGLQHASFNACADLGAGWEYTGGLVVLTLLVAAARSVSRRTAR